jgi:hypothetical protein
MISRTSYETRRGQAAETVQELATQLAERRANQKKGSLRELQGMLDRVREHPRLETTRNPAPGAWLEAEASRSKR